MCNCAKRNAPSPYAGRFNVQSAGAMKTDRACPTCRVGAYSANEALPPSPSSGLLPPGTSSGLLLYGPQMPVMLDTNLVNEQAKLNTPVRTRFGAGVQFAKQYGERNLSRMAISRFGYTAPV